MVMLLTFLVHDCVKASPLDSPFVIQRANLGVVFKKQPSTLDMSTRTWNHVARLNLPVERLSHQEPLKCENETDVLCHMNNQVTEESQLFHAKVNARIRAVVDFARLVLPRVPGELPKDSETTHRLVGDAFGKTLSKVWENQGTHFTNLTSESSLFFILSVPSISASAAISMLDVERYKEAITHLLRGRLTRELIDPTSMKMLLKGVRDHVSRSDLDYRLAEKPMQDFYTSVQVQGYIDNDFLYISIPFTIQARDRREFNVFQVSTFPVAAGSGSPVATQIVDLPEYFAIDRDLTTYMELSSEVLACFSKHDAKRCTPHLEMQPLLQPSCVLGVYGDWSQMIGDHCMFNLVHRGAEASLTEIVPGVVLMNNVQDVLLDCPRYHREETTRVLPPCTQCIRYVPCGCAVKTDAIHLFAHPCRNGTSATCPLHFWQPVGLYDDRHSLLSEEMTVEGKPCPSVEDAAKVTHVVNMALWMAYNRAEDYPDSLGGAIFPQEFPNLDKVFQGWNSSLAKRIREEMSIIQLNRQSKLQANPSSLLVGSIFIFLLGLIMVACSMYAAAKCIYTNYSGRRELKRLKATRTQHTVHIV